MSQIKYTAVAVVSLCIISIIFFKGAENVPPQKHELKLVVPLGTPVIFLKNPFADVVLKAKSAYIIDLEKHVSLFKLNSTLQLPLASLTKIMTAISAEKLSTTTTEVVISAKSLKQEGDNGLRPGEKWKLSDLLKFTLLVSSNDGASAIAGAFTGFVDAMNQNARDIGLPQTYFMNESGLDVSRGLSGGYGSAEDVAKLFEYAVSHYPDIFLVTKEKKGVFVSENNISHVGENTNKVVSDIPGLIASKTGTTDLAGGNLVIEFLPKEGHPVIIVVMGSTIDGRFDDMLTLVHATKNYFDSLKI
ncbi:MAG: D-alanyl-D-alanine carboxypeptidase [Candidatus Taylorbacteria bacterium]|nr:D-alanyl-D-alanine carboxypeptidase [Candidatus Taylorbacteria bacterium]